MTSSREVKAVEIGNASDIDFVLPNGFSFFESYLQYFLRETLGAGGEAYSCTTTPRRLGQFTRDQRKHLTTFTN